MSRVSSQTGNIIEMYNIIICSFKCTVYIITFYTPVVRRRGDPASDKARQSLPEEVDFVCLGPWHVHVLIEDKDFCVVDKQVL